jgi:hypothetical protein
VQNKDAIAALLQSKKPTAQLLGLGCAFLFFIPALTDIADNPSLTIWGRIGRAATAAGQLFLTVGLAGVDPRFLSDQDDEPQQGK